jgi:hypothetical protein
MDNKEAVAVIKSNWPPSNRTMLVEALELSIKSLEAEVLVQQTTNKPSTQCYNKTCDAALNGECDFANVLCKIRQRTAHIG